ncbi:MAG: ABC transporter permease [Cellulosilyticaceae bacterium]
MSGRYKRISLYILILFSSLFAWSIGLTSAQKVSQFSDLSELRYDKPEIAIHQLEKMLETEEASKEKTIDTMVAWRQTKGNKLQNQVLQTSAKADVLEVYGDIRSLIPMNKLVGESLGIGDKEGVIISEPIAYELWGSMDVIGKTIVWNEKDYTVRGVLEEESKLVIAQAVGEAEDAEEAYFSALRIRFVDNENILQQTEHFRNKYGLPQATVIDLSLVGIVLSRLGLLPGWVIGFWMIGKFYNLVYKNYKEEQQGKHKMVCIVLGILAVGITWVILDVMQFSIEVPSHLIPNKWSDFEFWMRLWTQLEENQRAISSLPTLIPDLWRSESVRILLGSMGLAIIGFVMFMKKVTTDNLGELFWQVLSAIIISFIVIVIGYTMGISVVVTKAFWLIVPTCVGVKFITCNWQEILK